MDGICTVHSLFRENDIDICKPRSFITICELCRDIIIFSILRKEHSGNSKNSINDTWTKTKYYDALSRSLGEEPVININHTNTIMIQQNACHIGTLCVMHSIVANVFALLAAVPCLFRWGCVREDCFGFGVTMAILFSIIVCKTCMDLLFLCLVLAHCVFLILTLWKMNVLRSAKNALSFQFMHLC